MCLTASEATINYVVAWCGVIWTPYDWFNYVYTFYIAVVVGIISGHDLSIDAHHRNQPNKS